jgi:uncharacterized protein (TIGR00251 family)
MQDFTKAIQSADRGTVLAIEVTPGSRANLFPAGFNPWRDAVGCQVTSPPVEGKANKAVLSLIADSLGIPRTRVSLLSGSGSSRKKILLEGVSAADLAAFLKARI